MSQQNNANEDMLLIVLVILLVGGGGFGIWFVFHDQLLNALRWVRWAELWVVGLVRGDDYAVAYPGVGAMTVRQWRNFLRGAQPSEITFEHVKVMSQLAVLPLRIGFAALLGFMALYSMFRGPGTQFRRRMNLEQLMAEQAKSFPSIQPFLAFDPRKLPARAPGQPVPAQLPLFSEALSPEEWLAYHEVAVIGGKRIDVNRAHQALLLQLGRRWQGPEKLPVHMQGLYAVFALKHVRKRKDSEALLGALSLAWSADKGFRPSAALVSQIRKIIRDKKVGGEMAKHVNRHAWETTAMLRALARARAEGGVLASAEFLWLRGHDRGLWYPLNNLGRKSYHAEAAGAMVHYTNEIISGQRIPTARFDEVIRGFETYLKSGVGHGIPELDKKAAGGGAYWKK